jgi:hypothetical protein
MSVPRLYVRENGKIVDAPAADQAVVDGYGAWSPKGAERDGLRLTIMTDRTDHEVGDTVRVIHVVEALRSGVPLHVMGPKDVVDEFVDGQLATGPSVPGADPLVPVHYDGPVLDGPGLDVNWELTEHRFDTSGEHTIQWRPGDHESNVIRLVVTE